MRILPSILFANKYERWNITFHNPTKLTFSWKLCTIIIFYLFHNYKVTLEIVIIHYFTRLSCENPSILKVKVKATRKREKYNHLANPHLNPLIGRRLICYICKVSFVFFLSLVAIPAIPFSNCTVDFFWPQQEKQSQPAVIKAPPAIDSNLMLLPTD